MKGGERRRSGGERLRVKICGVTRPEDALAAAELGADFIGLNFYPPSPRYLEPERAAEIAEAVRGRVKTVGVFVDRPAGEVEEIAVAVGLDLLQFHGSEGPAEIAPFASRAIKVFRVRDRIEPALLRGFEGVWGYLFDARHPQLYGGSGESWRFGSLRRLATDKPVLIAGGLGPATVRAAVAAASPWGVDVCSGVESAPGRKQTRLLRELFQEISDGESRATA